MWDLSLPGYKYLGPGNSLKKGKPNNHNDGVAYVHDVDYDEIEKRGKNPYLQYSKADERARLQFTHADYGGTLGKTYFTGKKAAWKIGLIPSVEQMGRLRGAKRNYNEVSIGADSFITPEAHNPKYLRTGISPAAKKKISFTDLPTTSQPPESPPMGEATADGGGSGNDGGLKETPVDNVYDVHRGPPNYTFASLPFLQQKFIQTNGSMYDNVWRMTSPYDCDVATTTTDLNAGAGTYTVINADADANDSSVKSARWFNFYAGMYKYYSVISCRWKCLIENRTTAPVWVHMSYMNDTNLPNDGTNQDMLCWEGVQSRLLQAHAVAVTTAGELENNPYNASENRETEGVNVTANFESGQHVANQVGSPVTVFTGQYKPGQYNRDIRLDVEVENWTQTTTNPLLPERLLIRVKPVWDAISTNNTSVYDRQIAYNITYSCDYLVEFKELQPGLKYPVQRQPITVTINSSATSLL